MELLFWTSLGLIFYIYFGYFLLIFLISRFYPEPEFAEMTELPRISMIIAAYNEEKVIEEKIKNCLALDYPPELLEILIGSDGSNDKTNSILNNCKENNIKVFISNSRKGKSWILNRLVEMSSGEILVFTDAEIIFDANVLKKIVKPFSGDKVGGVCGRLFIEKENGTPHEMPEQKYWKTEIILRRSESRIGTTFGVSGSIYAIRRSLYATIPVEAAVADDTFVLCGILKKGHKFVFCENAKARVLVKDDIFDEMRRRIRICACNLMGIRFFASLLYPKTGFVALGIWSHKILRWIAPLPLIMVFGSTFFLLEVPFYQWALGLEFVVLGLAIIGIILNLLKIKIKFLTYPMYFFVINFGLLIGIFKFLFGLQKPYWEPTARP